MAYKPYKTLVIQLLPLLATSPSLTALSCHNGLLVPQTFQAFSSLRVFICTLHSVWNTLSSALPQASSSAFRSQFKGCSLRAVPFQEHPPPPSPSCATTAGFGVLPSTYCNLNYIHISSSDGLLPIFPLSKGRVRGCPAAHCNPAPGRGPGTQEVFNKCCRVNE